MNYCMGRGSGLLRGGGGKQNRKEWLVHRHGQVNLVLCGNFWGIEERKGGEVP